MATRFGGSRPAAGHAARQRLMIGGLVSVVVILVVLLLVVKANNKPQEEPVAEDNSFYNEAHATSNVPTTIDILVASQRIEEGALLMPNMFDIRSVQPDRVPDGAVLARERANIANKYAKKMISANLPLIRDDISESPTITTVTRSIPPGYRAVTITVDARSGVEGWAKPNTRVDVLWTYTDKDQNKKVTTIVNFCKVLSVNASTGYTQAAPPGGHEGKTTVTLLLKEKDAKRVELARTIGELSLSLVGDNEPGRVASDPEPVTLEDLLPKEERKGPAHQPPPDGVMFTTDPITGKSVKYELRKNRWVLPGSGQ